MDSRTRRLDDRLLDLPHDLGQILRQLEFCDGRIRPRAAQRDDGNRNVWLEGLGKRPVRVRLRAVRDVGFALALIAALA
jgi:hypothetical protein